MFLIVPGGVPGSVLAPFWTHFGVLKGSLGAFWRRLGRLLGSCGGPKGALARFWVSLGRSGGVWGGVFWSLKGLGAVLDVSEGSLGCSWDALGRFCSF